MLKNYMHYGASAPVPYTHRRYHATQTGTVIDTRTQTDVYVRNGYVQLHILDDEIIVPLAWVIALAYKPLYEARSFIRQWTAVSTSDHPHPHHPANLIWQPPTGGQPCPECPEYYVIPGCSRMAIRQDGVVYNRHTRSIVPTYLTTVNAGIPYRMFTAINDVGMPSSLTVHRALALAFLPYDATVTTRAVSHRNGDTTDNRLENLAYITYSENALQALNENSRTPVSVKDYVTETITAYTSFAEASKAIGVNIGYLHRHVMEHSRRPLQFRYVVRLTEGVVEWPAYTLTELQALSDKEQRRKASVACMAYNVYTDQWTIAKTPNELGMLLGLTVDQVWTGLEAKFIWPSLNHIFIWLHRPKPVPIFLADELTAFKDQSGIRKPFRVTDTVSGQSHVFVRIDVQDARCIADPALADAVGRAGRSLRACNPCTVGPYRIAYLSTEVPERNYRPLPSETMVA